MHNVQTEYPLLSEPATANLISQGLESLLSWLQDNAPAEVHNAALALTFLISYQTERTISNNLVSPESNQAAQFYTLALLNHLAEMDS